MHVVHVPWVYLPCQEGPGKRREEHVRSVPPGDQRGRPERQRPHYPRVEDQPAHHLGPGRTRRVAESGHPWLDELLRQVLPDRDVRAPAPHKHLHLSLIHISEPTRLGMISYAVFCLKKKKKKQNKI